MIVKLDPLYSKAMEFLKNYNKTHKAHGMSNIYVIRKIDSNGNEIETYFCNNVITDYGMQQFFVNNVAFPTNLYIGNGSGTFNHTTNTLLSAITTIPATVSDSSKNYNYPLYYDSVSGLVTAVAKYLVCYFPENITDITNTITISEYGIGTSTTELWTHSWIYDNLGRQTTISKAVNERLEITVYFCLTYHEDLINNAYNNGKYIAITTPRSFIEYRMKPHNVYQFKRKTNPSNVNISTSTSAFIDNQITHVTIPNDTISSPYLLSPGIGDTQGFVDGYAYWSGDSLLLEHEIMNRYENFDSVQVTQNSYVMDDDCLTRNFGDSSSANYLPFTSLEVEHSYTFNYLNEAYDNEETFNQSNDKWYNEFSFMFDKSAPKIFYTNNNTVSQLNIFINMHRSDPIVGFNNPPSTIYATDKYWDTSSWVLVINPYQIPVELQNKKYWITNLTSSDNFIDPIRGNTGFGIKAVNTNLYKFRYGFPSIPAQLTCEASSYEYGWFALGPRVYKLSNNSLTQFTTDSYLDPILCHTIGFENMIVNINSSNVDRINYLNINDNPPSVSYISIDTSLIASIMNTYKTETGTGFAIFKSTNSSYAYKIDMRNNNVSATLMSNIAYACCIWGTNNYAYIDSNSGNEKIVYVKSLIDNSLIQTFIMDSSLANPNFIFGYQNILYIGNKSNYTYCCDITAGTKTICNKTLNYSNDSYIRFAFTDVCVLIYDCTSTNTTNENVSLYSNPTNFTALTNLNVSDSYKSRIWYSIKKYNNNTLILIKNTGRTQSPYIRNDVHDLGLFLYDNTTETVNRWRVTNNNSQFIPFGDEHILSGNYRFLLANTIPHRLTGKTNSITAYNTIKHLENKEWTATFTNIASFNGLPPGQIQ